MSETATAEAAATETEAPEPTETETDWKAEARKWEQRAKENRDAASKLKEIEDSQKSELEKATARAEAAEKRVGEFERAKQITEWASEIVKDSTIPAAALRGTTREELEEHFEVLKGIAPAKSDGPRAPQQKTKQTQPKDDPISDFANRLFGQG